MKTTSCPPDAPLSGRRQNLARDLNATDPAVRRQADERLPAFLNAAFRTAMSVLRHRQDAQDVVSDRLAVWLENPGRYNDNHGASDLTWFKIVVRHAAISRLRHRYVERRELPYDPPDEPLDELLEILSLALDALSSEEQHILRTYLSLPDPPKASRTGARLAGALGVSEQKAKARFAAAIIALRREVLLRLRAPAPSDHPKHPGWL
jgi:RNA polymerase sigma factor (sigma-70 family)